MPEGLPGGMSKLRFDWYITATQELFNVPVKSKLQHLPPGPPGILIFGKFLFISPPLWAEKLFECPHPQVPSGEELGLISQTAAGNRAQKIIVYTVKTILIYKKYLKIDINRCLTPSNTEQSLYSPFVFSQSATNTQSFLCCLRRFRHDLSTQVESA